MDQRIAESIKAKESGRLSERAGRSAEEVCRIKGDDSRMNVKNLWLSIIMGVTALVCFVLSVTLFVLMFCGQYLEWHFGVICGLLMVTAFELTIQANKLIQKEKKLKKETTLK